MYVLISCPVYSVVAFASDYRRLCAPSLLVSNIALISVSICAGVSVIVPIGSYALIYTITEVRISMRISAIVLSCCTQSIIVSYPVAFSAQSASSMVHMYIGAAFHSTKFVFVSFKSQKYTKDSC